MTDNEKLDLILSKMAGIEQSITGLEQSVMGIKQNVTGIEQSVAGLEQSVTGIEQRIEELEAGFEQKLEIIDQRLTRLESHIENVTDKNIRIVAEGHVDLNRKLNEVIHVTSDIKANSIKTARSIWVSALFYLPCFKVFYYDKNIFIRK